MGVEVKGDGGMTTKGCRTMEDNLVMEPKQLHRNRENVMCQNDRRILCKGVTYENNGRAWNSVCFQRFKTN